MVSAHRAVLDISMACLASQRDQAATQRQCTAMTVSAHQAVLVITMAPQDSQRDRVAFQCVGARALEMMAMVGVCVSFTLASLWTHK